MFLKSPQGCKIHLALNRGWFEAVLMKNTPRTLGVKYLKHFLFKKDIMKMNDILQKPKHGERIVSHLLLHSSFFFQNGKE
jgi:hypothetical protein